MMNLEGPAPFCSCWHNSSDTELGDPFCSCGEELNIVEWHWEVPMRAPKWVHFINNKKEVTFHPHNTAGSAIVKGNIYMEHNVHYYWEVKMLTQPYGTEVMVGLGTLDTFDFFFRNSGTYGISYTGDIYHNSKVKVETSGFCKGSIIGVMVDMFHGTLEFYLNRVPQGICFTNLRSHRNLYPMVCSTDAKSSIRLTYASSWRNSLLINAAKVLAASPAGEHFFNNLPPGLANTIKNKFWISLKSAGKVDKKVRAQVLKSR